MKFRKLFMWVGVLGAAVVATGIFATSGFDPGVSPDNPRFRASVALLALYGQTDSVERYVRENHTLEGAGRRVDVRDAFIKRVVVSDTASMVAFDKRDEFVVFLEPSLIGQQIKWRCSVVPAKLEPKPCRAP